MCDTQVLVGEGAVWFAKNSDREPDEPQAVVRLPAVGGDTTDRVRATHIDVAQVPRRHAVILSKPSWIWGAEMGVNDRAVVIGNEAIFSRRASAEPALLGMDLVRLGLERGGTAREALEVIAGLLRAHGQGGPAGYRDKSFCYDNSFLIADPSEAWVLETAGRDWAAKRVQRAYAISNGLTLGRDYELGSIDAAELKHGFARAFDTRFLPFFAGSAQRRALSTACLAQSQDMSFTRLASHLRQHRGGRENGGSNGDVCMHAAGFVRRHQTTGSMIARLSADGATALFTGTSAPCLSIFRPAFFEGTYSVITPAERERDAPLWYAHEAVHRRALFDAELRRTLRATRDDTEGKIFQILAASQPTAASLQQADRLAAAWQMVMLREAQRRPVKLSRFWTRLSRAEGTLA